MGKRGAAACQTPPQVSQRPQRRRKETADDAASASGLRSKSNSTTSSRTGLWQQPETPDDAAAAPELGSCSAVSPAERRPRQAMKPNTPATAAAAQARFSVSWRAKRRRTVRSGPAVGSRWRDWAGLDEGPAGLIAERVLANDVADYVRFRAACLPWRRCCADPRARGVLEDPRLYPRHWIMLRDDYENLEPYYAPHGIRRRFLNTETGRCVRVDVPELRDHGVLCAAADGLLVLQCKQTEAVRLLNPLTRQTAELPPTTGVVKGSPCCAGLVDHSTVCVYARYAKAMAIARPGDDRWALLDTEPYRIRSTVFFGGRFYGVTAVGILVTVDMAGDRGPRLVVAAEGPKPFTFRTMTDTVHLVDNGDGDLRLVHRTYCPIRGSIGLFGHACDRWMYRVYRVNLSTGKTTTRGRRNLGGRAIFIDVYGGLSVSPRVFPFLTADTVYLGLHCDERGVHYGQIGAYHVRDGSIEPPGNDDSDNQRRQFAHPFSIADNLIAYVSG